ncbi:MAG: hypothetical protein WDO18_06020 [Acidobacteriota bacterium]
MTRSSLSFIFLTAAFSAAIFAQAPVGAAPPKPAAPKPARTQPPARILDFKADSTSLQPGQSATLIWATENPNATTIMPAPGRVTPRGSAIVTPSTTTTYTLTVTGPNSQVETRQITVKVAGTTEAPITVTIDTPATVARINGHPDFSGVYGAAGGGIGGGRGGPAAPGAPTAPAGPELKPGKESYRVVRGAQDAGALADCMPIAGPAAYTVPYQFQLVQNANFLLILHEYPGIFRIVPLPQGPTPLAHPVDPDPTWLGDSIAKWDGDTLVIDTVGFNTRTELSGYKHSESLHIVERFKRPTPDSLEYEATLEDPEVFVKPWTVARRFGLRPDLKKIDEFVCENNKDYKALFK